MGIDQLFGASTPDIPNVELGIYDAKLIAVGTLLLKGGQYGDGLIVKDENGNDVNRFRWEFALIDDDGQELYELDENGEPTSGDPLVVDTVTGLQFFPKAKNPSKQTRLMLALLSTADAAAWTEGEKAPTISELIGRPVQVQVGENAKGYPTVVNVLPPRQKRAKPRRAAAAIEPDDEE